MTGGYTNHYTTGDHSNAYHSKHPLFCSAIVALVVSLSLAQGAYMVKDFNCIKESKVYNQIFNEDKHGTTMRGCEQLQTESNTLKR